MVNIGSGNRLPRQNVKIQQPTSQNVEQTHQRENLWLCTANYEVGISEAALLSSSLTVMMGDLTDISTFVMNSTARIRSNGCAFNGAAANLAGPSASCPAGIAEAQGLVNGHAKHLDGINMAFADGHVKWYKGVAGATGGAAAATQVRNVNTPFSVSGNSPTFNATRQ